MAIVCVIVIPSSTIQPSSAEARVFVPVTLADQIYFYDYTLILPFNKSPKKYHCPPSVI